MISRQNVLVTGVGLSMAEAADWLAPEVTSLFVARSMLRLKGSDFAPSHGRRIHTGFNPTVRTVGRDGGLNQ